ncbi:MAG: hypothetical protein AAF961_14420, partial [Planctomycetota bacterium]
MPLCQRVSGNRHIVSRLINSCWFLFKLGATLLLVGGLAAGAYLYTRMDEEIRRVAEQLIAEKCPSARARVGGARRIEGRGVALYDVELLEPTSKGESVSFLSIDEVFIECRADLKNLVSGQLDCGRVVVKHPRLELRRRSDKSWNFQSFLPIAACGNRLPQIAIQSGSVSLADESSKASALWLRDVSLTVNPQDSSRLADRPLTTIGPGQSNGEAAPSLPAVVAEGDFTGPHVKHGTFRVATDATTGQCAATMQF